jgi:predicted amidohydrolase YtcJ
MSSSGAYPSRADLDSLVSDRPVLLFRNCHHIAVCNTLALVWCFCERATLWLMLQLSGDGGAGVQKVAGLLRGDVRNPAGL